MSSSSINNTMAILLVATAAVVIVGLIAIPVIEAAEREAEVFYYLKLAVKLLGSIVAPALSFS
jgi:hypothetical protein